MVSFNLLLIIIWLHQRFYFFLIGIMKTNKLTLTVIICFAFFGIKFQCGRDYLEPIEEKYSFEEKISISPYNLNYNVGDTMWLNFNVPGKKLFDTKTSTRVFYDSANFHALARVSLLYNNPFIADGPVASFIFPTGVVAQIGNYSGQTDAYVTFGCSPATDYKLLLGIVLIKKGAFSVSFNNNYVRECFTDQLSNARLTFQFDVADTHKQFYQQLPFANIGKKQDEYVLQQLDSKSAVVINVQ